MPRLTLALGALLALGTLLAPGAGRADFYAVTDRGELFRSTDAGAGWTALGRTGSPDVAALRPGMSTGDLLVLDRSGDLRASGDGGGTWGGAVGNVGASDCVDLAGGRAGDLYALTAAGDVHRSADGGVAWTLDSGLGHPDAAAICAGGDISGPDSLFAATADGVVLASAGAGWSVRGIVGFAGVADLVWVDGELFALTGAGEVLRSSDAGATWSLLATVSQTGMRSITRDRDGAWMAVGDHGDVATSADAAAWSWTGTVNQVWIVAVAPDTPELTGVPGIAPAAPARLLAWPNPFRSGIRFALPGSPASATLEIVDVSGRRIADLSGARASDGTWSWRPARVAPAPYFARARWPDGSAAARIVFIR